jgi:hypothetical protein
MFTYVGFFRLAPLAREHPEKTPEYFEKVHKIVGLEGGTLERFMATMGPWEYLAIFKFPPLCLAHDQSRVEISSASRRTTLPSGN